MSGRWKASIRSGSAVQSDARQIVQSEPAMASFVYATVLNHDRLEDAIVHRIAQRLDNHVVNAELIRCELRGCARRRAVDRRGDAGRPCRGLRPRPGMPPLHRAGPLFQGLPRHRDASAGALAVASGPSRFRLLSAKPLVGGLPDRHQSGGADRQGHLPRSCDRAGRRRDRGHRGRCLDSPGRDARRNRQGGRRPPSQDQPWRADRRRARRSSAISRSAAARRSRPARSC